MSLSKSETNIILRAFLQGKIGVHLFCFGPEQREAALRMVAAGVLTRTKENMLIINHADLASNSVVYDQLASETVQA